MKRKCCKRCKIFVDGDTCPICKGNQFSTIWKGRITIMDAKNSEVAKKLGIEVDGEYALKC